LLNLAGTSTARPAWAARRTGGAGTGTGAGLGLGAAMRAGDSFTKAAGDALKPEAFVAFQLAPNESLHLAMPKVTVSNATLFLNNELVFGYKGNAVFAGTSKKTPLTPEGVTSAPTEVQAKVSEAVGHITRMRCHRRSSRSTRRCRWTRATPTCRPRWPSRATSGCCGWARATGGARPGTRCRAVGQPHAGAARTLRARRQHRA
jgi:hypothetical protein